MNAPEYGNELVLPQTGVLVNLEDEREVTIAYRDLNTLKRQILEAERTLRSALAARSAVLGTKTFYVEGIGKVELRGGEEIEYDPKEVEDGLRALNCPEETIREIVVETVSYRVDGNRARRAAKANPEYGKVLEAARTVKEKIPTVHIS